MKQVSLRQIAMVFAAAQGDIRNLGELNGTTLRSVLRETQHRGPLLRVSESGAPVLAADGKALVEVVRHPMETVPMRQVPGPLCASVAALVSGRVRNAVRATLSTSAKVVELRRKAG